MRQRSDMKNETASKQASIARPHSPHREKKGLDILVICNSHRRCTSGKRERGDVIAGDVPALHPCEARLLETALHGARVFANFFGGCT